jgi:hypothetical protein
MSLEYSTDVGYGIRIVQSVPGDGRPDGHVVEIHFYNKQDAVKYAAHLVHAASAEAVKQWHDSMRPGCYHNAEHGCKRCNSGGV